MLHKECLYDMFNLQGRVAIVTGGNGRLGAQYVETLLRANAKVIVADIAKEPSEKISMLLDTYNGNIYFRTVDITNKEEVYSLMELLSLYDENVPSILVNNAGIDAPPNASEKDFGRFEHTDEEAWEKVLMSHLKSARVMSRSFIRALSRKIPAQKSSIINVSSLYGIVSPDQSLYDFRRNDGAEFFKPDSYTTAKAGMIGFTRWLAGYCAEQSLPIRVNCVVLGGVYAKQDDSFVRAYSKKTMLGRMANEDEYNGLMLFLASEKASSYITGAVFIADGGFSAY
ncbi:MAG: short-chain dehydrogenase [Candidatus Niyogibacteria bacterium CG10_big_fil_rev_8_21_14_0_10_46_36]|uniref:Short-chain dehydrogenase n=1 Tax=Candidatus Niyogibacteria bacterium CG10_big_fil_rev_8_21_14_0_10_46_36 TaxID=1974726 RepID=A0A2H0TEF2_9BACT|nr:MAG: short-chain dehydrogenase [Candidatus Niyogibacteria bacterium CG10_big_fil_rev_8_21_14_0_10_46_36]